MRNCDLVVLFSGGADSTLLLKFAETMLRKPFALLVDYGQLHLEELDYAREYCKKNAIENTTIKIEGYNVRSGLTSGEKGIYEGVDIHNVPARNTVFLSLAYGIAESKEITEIWYGPDWSDREHLFPDCYQEYIIRMNSLLEISGVKPIKVYAPTLGFTKEMVLLMLKNMYGITEKELFSGYGDFT